MKHYLVILICLLSFSSFAQRIKIDRIESNGVRLIETDVKSIGGPALSNYVGMGLAVKVEDGKTSWFIKLVVEQSQPIPQGSAFLIKLADDRIITLESVSDAASTSGSIPINFGNGLMMNVSVHKAYATYPITIGELEDIMKREVVKLRIETPEKIFDREIKGKTSRLTSRLYDMICKRLESDKKVKSIYDDF